MKFCDDEIHWFALEFSRLFVPSGSEQLWIFEFEMSSTCILQQQLDDLFSFDTIYVNVAMNKVKILRYKKCSIFIPISSGMKLDKRIEEAVPAGQQLQELGMRLRCLDDGSSDQVS